MTKGMINPTITKADTFASAIPSTLFPAYAKIIIAATTLSIVANMDMINVVHNDISIHRNEKKKNSIKNNQKVTFDIKRKKHPSNLKMDKSLKELDQ